MTEGKTRERELTSPILLTFKVVVNSDDELSGILREKLTRAGFDSLYIYLEEVEA